MTDTTKRALIWAAIIIFGGGILSALLGHGFWGEKQPARSSIVQPLPENWGSSGPNQGPQCEPDCDRCHPEK